MPFSIGYGRKVLTKSGVGISRKCCFPHGLKGVRARRRADDIMMIRLGIVCRHNNMMISS
jgi:hypothetical protein